MADDDNDESNRFKNNEAPSQHHQRRFSSQLQPINEELTQRFNKQRKQPPNSRTPTQYDCGSSFNTGSQNKLPIRTIVMPKIENSSGHVNPAYDGFGDDDSDDDDEKGKIISRPPPPPPSPPQSSDPKRPSRQVSFDPEQSNAEKQNSINVPNDSNNANKNEKPKIEPKSSLKKQSSNEDNDKNDDDKNKKDAKEKLPEWDRFVTLPPPDEDETQKSEWVEVAIRWLKIFAYLFTFVMILMLSVCSKSLTMLMTSMASVNHTVAICNSDKHYYIDPPLEHDRPYKAIYMATTTTRLAWVWCLYFASVAPYLFAFGRSVRIIYFKTLKIPRFETICTVFVAETLHCIGLSIIVFVLLPQMGVIKGVMMMNVVCFVPSIIRLMVEPSSSPTGTVPEKVDPNKILNRNSSIISIDESTVSELIDEDQGSTLSVPKFDHLKLATNRRLAIINCSLQSLMITCWTFIAYQDELEYFYLMPIALILVSFEWWENYVIPDMMKSSLMFLSRVCDDLKNTRYFVFSLILPWKILLIFSMMVLNEYIENGSEVTGMLFKNFTDGFRSATIDVWRDKGKFYSGVLFDTDHHQLHVGTPLWPLWILLIHVSVTYLDYAFAKFTCKVCFQTISFAIPLCLTVPVTVSFLWGISSVAVQDKCELVDDFEPFQYIFWNQNDMDIFDFDLYSIFICTVWTIGFINQVTNTFHIWNETSERLASTEQLFVSPMYNSVMIDQSLILNRRCFKLKFSPVDEEEDHEDQPPPKDVENNQENAEKPMLDGSDGNKVGDELRQELPLYSYNPMYDYANQMESLVHGDAKDSAPSSMVEEDWTKDWKRVCEMMGIEEDSIDAKTDPAEDETIRIYVCATMWHEDQNEMFQMLKAVMRLDYEQGIRRITKKTFGHMKKSIFEIEVNIYFDDAFEQGKTDDEDDRVVNRFVEQLIDTIGPAANQVFGQNLHLETPTIVPTPYGGKLIWKMPFGTNRLIAHIKDKNLIRHRKRWSQCMYMYYLLGYRLAARKDLSLERKKTIMNNTFVLALDGDINFRPQAVDLVVDLMKKNNNLGAACGRIHPIGSGPIVWYQKFEYAMGHWLQKATEHVIGCVLCSPGCFSLFRARALMDKSVMNKYTTKPTAAQHFVQYDQGEDRWLCTLLLQRGWRIEYCAASDSFTHAPEGFAEFYTQRRRWGPSTMANILDLLGDYKQTVKTNDNISNLYILYQAFLMLGTIISPGTIFLMVVSAMNTVMGLSTQTSLLYNMIPLLAFLFVCLMFKDNNIKITFATILSVIYALLMLAVLVGTGIDMYTQGFFSPNSLFFSAMMASFIVAACLHPQEFACVIPLPIYMLFIPSMYMLLTIYSITNMHIVSWGTREVKSKLSAKELQRQKEEEEAKAKAAASKKKSNFLNLSNVGGTTNGLFTCMCCSGSAQNDNINGTIQEIQSEVKEISKLITKEWCNDVQGNQDAKSHQQPGQGLDKKEEKEKNDLNNQAGNDDKTGNDGSTGSAKESLENEIRRRSPPTTRSGIVKKPRWVRNNARLNTWKIRPTPEREEEFWKKMISKYLYPLDEDLKEKERISSELEDLRNKWVFAFMFLNIIFILFVFMLQIHKDVFGIDIPVGVNGTTRKYDDNIEDFVTETNVVYTRMDPINLTLVIFFGAILIIQCIGMFIHRFGTLAHLLAYTEIHEKRSKFDYCQVVEELIRDKTKNTRRYKSKKKANKNGKNTSNSNNTDKNDGDNGDGDHDQESGYKPDDSANSSDVEVKPVEYGELVVAAIQKLTSDQSQLDKMSKIKRKNTMLAIKRHEKHQLSNQARLRDRRDSIASSASSVQRQSSNASMQYQHRKVFPTNSNMSQMSQVTIVDTSSIKSGDQNQANHQQSTSTGIQQQPMSTFFSSSNNDPGSQQESSSTF